MLIFMHFRALPLTLEDLQKVMQSTNSESLKFSAVEMDACWMDEIEVLSASVKLFIEKAANQDWMLRVRWLNHLTKNLPQVLGKYLNYFTYLRPVKFSALFFLAQQQ